MKKKRVLEVFVVEIKGVLKFSHKDISGKTTLYDSFKLTTITELGGFEEKQPVKSQKEKPPKITIAKTEIYLCEMPLGLYRKYILKIGSKLITQRRVVNPTGKVKFKSVLMCDPADKAAATKIIKEALPEKKMVRSKLA